MWLNMWVALHYVWSWVWLLCVAQGIQELREQMLEVTLQQQYMGEKIPGVMLGFEEAIKKYCACENCLDL